MASVDDLAVRYGDGAVGRRGGQVHGVGRRRGGLLPRRRQSDKIL